MKQSLHYPEIFKTKNFSLVLNRTQRGVGECSPPRKFGQGKISKEDQGKNFEKCTTSIFF
jgi:hypothetical protein